jgi:hypothetical protein
MTAVQTILPNWTTTLAEHASIVAERNLSPFFLEEASADSMCTFFELSLFIDLLLF